MHTHHVPTLFQLKYMNTHRVPTLCPLKKALWNLPCAHSSICTPTVCPLCANSSICTPTMCPLCAHSRRHSETCCVPTQVYAHPPCAHSRGHSETCRVPTLVYAHPLCAHSVPTQVLSCTTLMHHSRSNALSALLTYSHASLSGTTHVVPHSLHHSHTLVHHSTTHNSHC